MAKIRHNNFIDTVDEVFSEAKKEGILHLYAEDKILTGRTIQIKGKEMFHFGTTGYLGLEQDDRLKEAAIQAIRNYGTQFPLSKSYISHPLYSELESKIEQMYGIPPIITKNSTLGHLAIIPTLIRDEDAVIIDHQVHWSVQNACQLLKLRGIPVEMIRHSNLDMLEDKIKQLSTKCNKIWYMADGVYSMFGDYAHIPELLALTQKYAQLNLYFDDVHGMSWKGKNGTGFVFDAIKELPENCIVVSTLSKTFGASGATLFCKNQKLREKIKNFGGPLTFSAQLEPASVAAAIASAEIHLSPEIELKQKDLADKIAHFNQLLSLGNLPIISKNDSPVFFLGMGTPATAYNFSKRLFKEGFFLNLGIYPAVPIKNTGIRITLSSHNQQQDITALAEALEYHFPKALEETNNSENKIRQAFGLGIGRIQKISELKQQELIIEEKSTIQDIEKLEWNQYMGKQNIFDWEGMVYLENTFSQHPDPTNQWDFYYYAIKDNEGNIILMTFFTYGLWKDDMLATESVSIHLEEIRKTNPLYLTSKVLSMGSLFTEGKHCFINQEHPLAEKAVKLLLDNIEEKYNALNADMLVLRDFEKDNSYNKTIVDQAYFRIDMPESCVIENQGWHTNEEFAESLSIRSRKHFYKEIEPYEKCYGVAIKNQLSKSEIARAYQLYNNVKDNNYAINTFRYSQEVFENMNESPNWEFIVLTLKADTENPFAGVMFCYKNSNHTYVPELIGMDYKWAKEYQLYRQLLFQTIKRANALEFQKIDFGVSASFEKRKLGARVIPKIAYVQARDNYAMELMNTLQNDYKSIAK
ncbi:bifunctional aminotransferase class I/II-fold pyridoxal phosphate-dependent enzyme/GNAT family N-acetyltransferase [Flavobacterium sp. M31R6]|uniref:bifunctional aminotransferase class I/II-fold pyridoxal phosphate-dependent enzyme/GNAT family N-acetyltransferase n=1 Tax=Flavobacterium sp. M31R6 TaxID=2739062 RepID=UPI0015695235|nr:bifunctional aminotransferase class I/II-fold pyridoxal phosphate-dependent enzyme/GNAT family N-acetyltransferase [Flavobacterium sp. M31R6]QKJ64217.1 aminotransferase class I/II-fold pyridoxal phosphate-dependent enzyme [Flavobacterium sp. M31R6]